MKSVRIFLLSCYVFFGLTAAAQKVPVVDFKQLKPFLTYNNDTTYVVNFWATWCKPCVEEMPHFIEAGRVLANEKVRFIMVSLDMPSKIDSKLMPYLAKYKLPGQVILLQDPNANSWIPQVDESWDGAIPVTLIYRGNERKFIPESFENASDLLTAIRIFNK